MYSQYQVVDIEWDLGVLNVVVCVPGQVVKGGQDCCRLCAENGLERLEVIV